MADETTTDIETRELATPLPGAGVANLGSGGKSTQKNPPKIKNKSSEQVFLNKFPLGSDSFHNYKDKNSRELFEKHSCKRGVFGLFSGFWVGLWASDLGSFRRHPHYSYKFWSLPLRDWKSANLGKFRGPNARTFHIERLLHQQAPVARFESQSNERRVYEDQFLCLGGVLTASDSSAVDESR